MTKHDDTMTLNFFTLLTILSMFIASVLALFFFVNKRGIVPENRLMALLLVVFSLQIIYSFATSFYAWQQFLPLHKPLFMIRQTSFLVGPLIWLYINSFLKRKQVFRLESLFHFLPFAAVWLFLLFWYRGTDNFVIWESSIDLYTTLLILGHNLVYIVLSVRTMKAEAGGTAGFLRNMMSSLQNRWLQILLIGFILVWVVNLNSFALYMILRRPGWCAYTESIYALAVFLFINAIMFVLLLRPDSYYIIAKYKNTKLKDPDKAEYLKRLTDCMEQRKLYLDPDITIESLASEISVSPRLLSQVINETYRKNFKSYILEYRIRESMKILADTKHAKLTVLEVLYQVGFNSKSAFNNQFKLYTNLTPVEYRARAIRA